MKAFIRNNGCPLCAQLKQWLPSDTEIYDIDTVDGMAEFANEGGGTTVPMLVVGGMAYFGKVAIQRAAAAAIVTGKIL